MKRNRGELFQIARRAMLERGLWPEFSAAVWSELSRIEGPATADGPGIRDLRKLPWCSIDNDDSKDLDQLSVSVPDGDDGAVRVLVAIADVDALVKHGTAIDRHAAQNTVTVYTGIAIFPMLPERLSTDLTSLNEGEDRVALVIDLTVDREGHVTDSDVYRGLVHNHARLAYDSVAAWLDGEGPMPTAIGRVKDLEENLRTQDRVAQQLRSKRAERGALGLETIEARPVFENDQITELRVQRKNRARELIEDLMIAANGATARFLRKHRVPAFRRVVRAPKRWGRIMEVAASYGEVLPSEPDCAALEAFLARRRSIDPLRFPDLSLVIVKLMGKGEYVVEHPGAEPIGHFGLAVRDYTHSTAPNRRFPDLVTHRLVKATLEGRRGPYDPGELDELARHATEQEDDAAKVERQVRKSAAAQLLESRIGDVFEGVITGAADKGTWVRVFSPPVEGKVVEGQEGLDVGEKVRVRLVDTDVERGFIDFVRA